MLISRTAGLLLAGASVVALAGAANAQASDEQRVFETIIVTTEKREASIQDVPIAVSAFDASALERLNIDAGVELQFAVPNLQLGKGNFTSTGNVSIRGIGNQAVGATADGGVGIHQNDVPMTSNFFFQTDYFDMERVEILRGPQGTLYGRNATGGVINGITAKPGDEFAANLTGSVGEFSNLKMTGFVNLPLEETLAVRLAGFYNKREGYTENLGTGNDIDGRDHFALRGSIRADFTDFARLDLMAQYYEEDSSRARKTKQQCARDTRPFPFNTGCLTFALDPTRDLSGPFRLGIFDYRRDGSGNPVGIQPGNQPANFSGAFLNLLGANIGLFPLGFDPMANTQVPNDIRTVRQDIDPRQVADEKMVQARFTYDFQNDLTLTLAGAFQENNFVASDDFVASQSATFRAVPGLTAPNGAIDPLFGGAFRWPYADVRVPTTNRLAAVDRSSNISDQTSFEARLASDFDGPFNFNVGVIKIDYAGKTLYEIFSNTGAAASAASQSLFNAYVTTFRLVPTNGVIIIPAGTPDLTSLNAQGIPTRVFATNTPLGFIPFDRGQFRNIQDYELDSTAFSGEFYYQVNDDFKITLGLRQTSDTKRSVDYANALAQSTLVAGPQIVSGETVTANRSVTFDETTGKLGFDWNVDLPFTEETLFYGNYAVGYKGGGFNPPISGAAGTVRDTFDPEFINALEFGAKNSILGGIANLNVSAFMYDYEDYQISKIVEQTSVNENVSADVMGAEVELFMAPTSNSRVDFTLGWLSTELGNVSSVDPHNVTAGRADYFTARNLVSLTSNCAVPVSAFAAAAQNPLLAQLAAQGAFCGFDANRNGVLEFNNPGENPFGASPGLPVNLAGNELPGAPEFTVSVGGQYSWALPGDWDMTLRGDYYYQTETYARLFNLDSDLIESWDNANLSLTFTSGPGDFFVEVYAKNILDSEQVVNSFKSDVSAGSYTNYFYLEPRQIGLTVGRRF